MTTAEVDKNLQFFQNTRCYPTVLKQKNTQTYALTCLVDNPDTYPNMGLYTHGEKEEGSKE